MVAVRFFIAVTAVFDSDSDQVRSTITAMPWGAGRPQTRSRRAAACVPQRSPRLSPGRLGAGDSEIPKIRDSEIQVPAETAGDWAVPDQLEGSEGSPPGGRTIMPESES